MGLFDGLLDFFAGNKRSTEKTQQGSTQSQTSTSNATREDTQTSDTTTSKAGVSTTTGTQTGTQELSAITSALSEQDLSILAGLTADLNLTQFDSFFTDTVRSLQEGAFAPLSVLTDKAAGGVSDDAAKIIAGLQKVTELDFDITEGGKIGATQQGIGAGSEFNTLSALIAGRGDTELKTRLAGIEASVLSDFESRERDAAIQAIAASEGLAQDVNAIGQQNFTNLLDALKVATGAKTVQEQIGATKATSQETTEFSEEELIQSIIELLSVTSSTSTGTADFFGFGKSAGEVSGTLNERQQAEGALLGGAGSFLSGAGSLAAAGSHSALKDVGEKVDTSKMLEKLELYNWRYKSEMAALGTEPHAGPLAEDFAEIFGGDGVTLNVLDVLSVALGAVKALSLRVTELESKLVEAEG